MNSEELKERIKIREKEIQKLDELMFEAEKQHDEKKIQRLDAQKLAARQEMTALIAKRNFK
jgi:uncharacterized membrane protein (DUF106 family)